VTFVFFKKLHFLIQYSLFIFVLSLCMQNASQAEDKVIKLATRMHLPPYVYHNAASGIEIDLIKAIFADIGRKIEFVQMPRVRMIETYDRGELEGILTQNANVSNIGCITDWYIEHQNIGFTLASEPFVLTKLSDLKGMSVLSFDGATRYLGKGFSDAVKGNKLYEEATNQESHIELIYKRRFNVVVGDEWILRLAQRNYFTNTGKYQKMVAHKIMPASLYSARFKNPVICEKFNVSLAKIRSSGEYVQIVNSYHQNIMIAGNRF